MGRPAPPDLHADAGGPAAATVARVAVDGIEVTQAVQDHLNAVPLVAGKRTVVRVYLSYAPAPVAVRGVLRVARSATGPWFGVAPVGAASLDPARSGSSPAALRSRRHDLSTSLNFVLPASFTAAGSAWLRLGSVRTQTARLPLAPRPDTRARFGRTAPLRVHLAKIRYTAPGSTATHLPSALDLDLIRSWLRRAFPVATVMLTTTTIDAPHPAPFDASEINALLIALRAVDVAAGTDRRTHYYGLVADSGGFMRGLASGIPQSPAPGTVASGPTGSATFGWDTDGAYGDWYTGHELAHTFGRFHAEFCGAGGGASYPHPDGQLSGANGRFVGLDVGDPLLSLPMRALPGTDWHDVMSYCDNQWLSSFTYDGIRRRLNAEGVLPAGAPGSASAGPGDAMAGVQVVASANLTRSTGRLSAVLPAPGEPSPPDDADGRSPFSVVLTTARGRVLVDQPVAFHESACEDPGDDVTGTIDAVVPAPPETRRVELRLGDEVLDSRPVGGDPAPSAGPGDAAAAAGLRAAPGPSGDDVVVEWDAPGSSPSRRYLVQASDDGGATWRTVGLDLAEPAVHIDPDDFPGRDELDIRVLASSGTDQAPVARDRIRLGGG